MQNEGFPIISEICTLFFAASRQTSEDLDNKGEETLRISLRAMLKKLEKIAKEEKTASQNNAEQNTEEEGELEETQDSQHQQQQQQKGVKETEEEIFNEAQCSKQTFQFLVSSKSLVFILI